MTTLDPLESTRRIEAAYKRYLTTTLNPRDPELHEEFVKLLNDPDHRLVRGPLIQAMAPYSRGSSLQELVADGVLHEAMLSVPAAVFPPTRPLYAH